MQHTNPQNIPAALLLFAVFAIVAASLLYLALPQACMDLLGFQNPKTIGSLCGAVCSVLWGLGIALWMALCNAGVFAFCILCFFRVCRLCLDTYLCYQAASTGQFLLQILFFGVQALLFLSFCHLGCRFSIESKHKKQGKGDRARLLLDFLFFSGICTILTLLRHAALVIRLLA